MRNLMEDEEEQTMEKPYQLSQRKDCHFCLCVVCSAFFYPGDTKRRTCSDSCEQILKDKQQITQERKQKEKE